MQNYELQFRWPQSGCTLEEGFFRRNVYTFVRSVAANLFDEIPDPRAFENGARDFVEFVWLVRLKLCSLGAPWWSKSTVMCDWIEGFSIELFDWILERQVGWLAAGDFHWSPGVIIDTRFVEWWECATRLDLCDEQCRALKRISCCCVWGV